MRRRCMLTSNASSVKIWDTFASKCTKLKKKTQATQKWQGNEKQYKSKEEKALTKRNCYSCREREHMAHSCPLDNTPKPISIYDDSMLRKDSDGTAMVVVAKHHGTHERTQTSLGTIKK
jgi:hypothetical protein